MGSRILSVAIVGFWIVMTSLLIHLERRPDNSNLLTLPPSHVFKLMFMHQQISELTITQEGKPVGNRMLHPKSDSNTNEHSLVFSGGFSFLPPGALKKQRLAWDGEIVMDHAFKMTAMNLSASLQDSPYHVHLSIDPAKDRAAYEVLAGNRSFKHSTIPLSQEGVGTLLRDELGIDPGMMQSFPVSLNSPTLTAKQTELKIRKENVVAYLLTLKSGETTLAEIYVSQLGQVLTAKTFLGYDFATEDASNPAMIQIPNLSKNFGHLKAVDNLNLDVAQGGIFRLPRPERRWQDHHHQDAHRPHPPQCRAVRHLWPRHPEIARGREDDPELRPRFPVPV